MTKPAGSTPVPSEEFKHGPVYVFVDNSNVWIEGKRLSGRRSKPPVESNHRYRVDYGNLLGVVQDGRLLGDIPRLYGSEPPPNDSVWKRIEKQGFKVEVFRRNVFNKEKGVDMKMGLDVGRLVYSFVTPTTVIIVAGDGDFVPVIEEAQSRGWSVEVWYWSNAAKDLKNAANRYESLDDRLYDVGFED